MANELLLEETEKVPVERGETVQLLLRGPEISDKEFFASAREWNPLKLFQHERILTLLLWTFLCQSLLIVNMELKDIFFCKMIQHFCLLTEEVSTKTL